MKKSEAIQKIMARYMSYEGYDREFAKIVLDILVDEIGMLPPRRHSIHTTYSNGVGTRQSFGHEWEPEDEK